MEKDPRANFQPNDFLEVADWCIPRIAEVFNIIYSHYRSAFWSFNTTHWGDISVLEFEDHLNRVEELVVRTKSFSLIFNGPRDEYYARKLGNSIHWLQKGPSIRFNPHKNAFNSTIYSNLMGEHSDAVDWLAVKHNLQYDPKNTSLIFPSKVYSWSRYTRCINLTRGGDSTSPLDAR